MSLIPDDQLLIEVIYAATGTTKPPGGQHAGLPPSSVRVTHIPSETMAQCGACRSQHKNKLIAIEMLEAALTSKWANELV